jgi:UDP-glucose 4-epimerase
MILITGGLGFIGLHATAAFLEAGENVVITTRSRSGRVPDFLAAHVDRRLFIEPADFADEKALQAIVRRHGIDGIVHLAAPAWAVPPLYVDSVQVEFRSNLLGLMAVLEAGGAAQVKRITIASSVAVYQSVTKGPFSEDMPLPTGARLGVEAFKKSTETLVDYTRSGQASTLSACVSAASTDPSIAGWPTHRAGSSMPPSRARRGHCLIRLFRRPLPIPGRISCT